MWQIVVTYDCMGLEAPVPSLNVAKGWWLMLNTYIQTPPSWTPCSSRSTCHQGHCITYSKLHQVIQYIHIDRGWLYGDRPHISDLTTFCTVPPSSFLCHGIETHILPFRRLVETRNIFYHKIFLLCYLLWIIIVFREPPLPNQASLLGWCQIVQHTCIVHFLGESVRSAAICRPLWFVLKF